MLITNSSKKNSGRSNKKNPATEGIPGEIIEKNAEGIVAGISGTTSRRLR